LQDLRTKKDTATELRSSQNSEGVELPNSIKGLNLRAKHANVNKELKAKGGSKAVGSLSEMSETHRIGGAITLHSYTESVLLAVAMLPWGWKLAWCALHCSSADRRPLLNCICRADTTGALGC
jgi:hypothetical protein